VSEEKAVSIVEGVLVRSRIKPLSLGEWYKRKVYLSVNLACMKLEGNNPVYDLDMMFANFSTQFPIKYVYPFGSLGIGPAASMERAIKAGVEQAVAAHLKANFDLGE
jgi:hypothetical protein